MSLAATLEVIDRRGDGKMKHFLTVGLLALVSPVFAQSVPVHAEGLQEELVSVTLADGSRTQSGVYSIKKGTTKHTRLAVLLPGYPSVVRPVVSDGVMQRARLAGNFLIRARRYLVDEAIATLIIDCHSDSGDYCSSSYQASAGRQRDVQRLIDAVKERYPTLEEVWLIGTSMGTISSSFMPVHDPKRYAGAIHTASITETGFANSYRELANFDYSRSGVPQFFVHHKNDPCFLTTWAGAKRITEKHNIPLITVFGGGGFQGQPCMAQTEHGFKGMEMPTMSAIGKLVKTGKVDLLEVK